MSLGDACLDRLSCGEQLDMVVVSICDELYRGLWNGDRFIVKGLGSGVWSLFGYRLVGKSNGVGFLESTEHSAAIQKPELSREAFLNLKETCCGIGGISAGASFVGAKTIAFNDKSGVACQTIRLNGGVAVEGDVSCPEVRKAIALQEQHKPCMLVAGFPCNSYSPQGSQGGLQDPRGQVLLSVLRLAWQVQAAGLLLECVPEVQEHRQVMALLDSFACRMGMQMSHVVLDLGDQWVSRRCRWWCTMVPVGLPKLELVPWGQIRPKPVAGDEIQHWPAWPLSEEQALAWTQEEKAMYGDERFGNDPRRLNVCSQAPTALHSWGAALRPCPCGCRAKAFSLHTLLHRGLRGFGIFSEVLQGIRFPHPAEVGYLNTLPPDFQHVSEPRTALVMVGQLAAPLQALWLSSQIKAWAEKVFMGTSQVVPEQLLRDYKHMLRQKLSLNWPATVTAADQAQCLVEIAQGRGQAAIHSTGSFAAAGGRAASHFVEGGSAT